MLCIVVYYQSLSITTVSADSGYPFLLAHFCQSSANFCLIFCTGSKDFVIRIGCIRNIKTDPGIVPLMWFQKHSAVSIPTSSYWKEQIYH